MDETFGGTWSSGQLASRLNLPDPGGTVPQGFASHILNQAHFTGVHWLLDACIGCVVFLALLQLPNVLDAVQHALVAGARTVAAHLGHGPPTGELYFAVEQLNDQSDCFTLTYRAIMHRLATLPDARVWWLKEKYLSWWDPSERRDIQEALYHVMQDEPILVDDHVWMP